MRGDRIYTVTLERHARLIVKITRGDFFLSSASNVYWPRARSFTRAGLLYFITCFRVITTPDACCFYLLRKWFSGIYSPNKFFLGLPINFPAQVSSTWKASAYLKYLLGKMIIHRYNRAPGIWGMGERNSRVIPGPRAEMLIEGQSSSPYERARALINPRAQHPIGNLIKRMIAARARAVVRPLPGTVAFRESPCSERRSSAPCAKPPAPERASAPRVSSAILSSDLLRIDRIPPVPGISAIRDFIGVPRCSNFNPRHAAARTSHACMRHGLSPRARTSAGTWDDDIFCTLLHIGPIIIVTSAPAQSAVSWANNSGLILRTCDLQLSFISEN